MQPTLPLRLRRLGAGLVLLPSLRGYRSSWLIPDLAAALTLAAIAVPEQLATARLAGMTPVTGLYAFVAGTVMFAVLGSNPQMSVGADSTIAPLFAAGVAALTPGASPDYAALVAILAVVVGGIVAAVGVLRLGWIAEFLSVPIIGGFLGGVASSSTSPDTTASNSPWRLLRCSRSPWWVSNRASPSRLRWRSWIAPGAAPAHTCTS
ncbi:MULTISPECIES: SulP family inorganic anion transporter [unclassified Mycolicibacterium]|uniref:SulP family inorganic anion transporter n=1 Tax=unclassified Mycolicibacterium TaxID=2636767 RepID=UPI002ED9D87F